MPVETFPRRRVVVTGVGAVSPVGLNARDTFQSLIEGKSGIDTYKPLKEDEPPLNSDVHIAGQVKDFDPFAYSSESQKREIRKDLRRTHRSAQFSTIAELEALIDADLLKDPETLQKGESPLKNVDPKRVGSIVGTGIGGGSSIADTENIIRDKGDSRVPGSAIFELLPERVLTVPSMRVGSMGPGAIVGAACASGSEAIGVAMDKILLNRADVMIAGATEASNHRVAVSAFNAIRALSTRNEEPMRASRPFNEDVDGFVIAEGAGILILEELEHALARKAHIYAELAGYADTMDAEHETRSSEEGGVRAMYLALEDAGVKPEEVDYVNAHGTSTPLGDEAELLKLKKVFGERLPKIAVSSTKSMTGHLLGAAGGLEAVISVMALDQNIVPPTINLENPIEPDMNLVPNKAERRPINVVMSNSFGFGGLNSVLIFRRYVPDEKAA